MKETNFYSFTQQLKENLEQEFEDDVRIDIHEVVKNNGVRYHALMIVEKDYNVCPNIGLEEFYFAYLAGNSIERIAEAILKIYDSSTKKKLDFSFFEDFERAKPNILFKIVNFEKNKERLQTMPHVKFLDLALTFYYYMEESPTDNGSVQIVNSHLDMWKVSAGEIYDLAMKNTESRMTVKMDRIDDLIMKLVEEEGDTLPADAVARFKENKGKNPMYVLSNQRHYFGAAVMYYPNALKNIAQRFGADLIILPSSIHEVILVPALDENYYRGLNSIIGEVNENHVSAEEVLSDHLYYYDRERDELLIPGPSQR